ncbi:MAG: hypothetical protein LBL52_02585, partial [Rickettsiales bacterium]|nr:hypothetical protein [Rickettsiales bacterium]
MKRVFDIPLSTPFLPTLSRFILDKGELSDQTVLLPTRRACRAFKEELLRASGARAIFLPKILPLGDVEEPEDLPDMDADSP